MINLLVAYDDNDYELGDYFDASYLQLSTQLLNGGLHKEVSVKGLDCTEANITARINEFNQQRFVFVGISHGNEEQLLTDISAFVSLNNSHEFHNSLFYTSACSCGSILGGDLVGKGCLTFIGYMDTVDVWEGFHDVFIECENFGILSFLHDDKTIGECVRDMKDHYSDAIDELSKYGGENTIVASILRENRDKLRIIGNPNLKSADFHINV